ncbi:rCG27610 [Rattus norvegicus]|uniref:RCG27610 n=1 Tax=Rattus norvegicus TaxID=10116 RepID=A6K794_RAT|nr:rCG27610 [Rattus norvegicus]
MENKLVRVSGQEGSSSLQHARLCKMMLKSSLAVSELKLLS